jgi:hypothetical protein
MDNRDESLNEIHVHVTTCFCGRFSEIANKLALADYLTCSELSALRSAAFHATLCRIAFNGLGGCRGLIKPSRERNRIWLEQRFMAEREKVLGSVGWQRLPGFTRQSAESILLRVQVAERNLGQ